MDIEVWTILLRNPGLWIVPKKGLIWCLKRIVKKLFSLEFWGEKWFAGGYVWKWFPNHGTAGGVNDNRFTPQNKPSLKIISDNYKKYSE